MNKLESAILTLTLLGGFTPSADGSSLTLIRVNGEAEVLGLRSVALQTSGPFGGVAVAGIGRTRAVQTGTGPNAVNAEGRFDHIRSFHLKAGTELTNTGVTPESFALQYLINGGELRLVSQPSSLDGLEATVAVSINTFFCPLFSGCMWEWDVMLRSPGGSATAEVHGFDPPRPLLDPLGLCMPTLSAVTVVGDKARLSIAPFTALADLGTLPAGSSSEVRYRICKYE